MAIKKIIPCNGGSSFNADFSTNSVIDGDILYITFSSNASLDGCYTVDSTALTIDETVSTISSTYSNCNDCYLYNSFQFEECGNSSNSFRFENVPGVLNIGDIYQITGPYFNGYATVVTNTGYGILYSSNGTVFIGSPSCPTPTPTQTSTTTPTPTPTPTPDVQISLLSTTCVCLSVDSNLIGLATGNTNTNLNGVATIEYTDCYGFTETYTQTSLSLFYLCTQSGVLNSVSYWKDNVQYTSTTFPWSPQYPYGISYSTYGTCYGNPCGPCSSTYCFRTTLPSLSGYSGNYTQAGTYNSNDYYEGDGTEFGVVYYTGDRWCLSSTLGGTCLLEGSYPCYSTCPDISANHFISGICPTPTPTPINCDIFDFTAYFDCDWEPIPTPTPSVPCENVDFKFSSILTTPTPTETNTSCLGSNVNFVICQINEPTPTVTLTPSVTLTKTVDVQGQVSFTMLDESFTCVSVKVLIDCSTGNELYTSDNLSFNGIPVTIGMTMFASINGNNMCVTYDRDDSNISSNSNVTSIFQLYSSCEYCSLIPTPTPTITSTATNTPTTTKTPTPTPTLTQTPTSTTLIETSTPTQTPTLTQTPTPSVTIGLTPSMTPSNTATPTITPSNTSTPTVTPSMTPTNTMSQTPTQTQTPSQTSTQTMTPTPSVTPNYVYVYESCSPINPNVLPSQVIQTVQTPWITVVNTTFKDVNGNCWKYVGQFVSTYISPPIVIPITFAGDYFTSAYQTVYADCVTCVNTPLCYEYNFENVTIGTVGSTSIRINLSTPCPGSTVVNTPVTVGDTRCIISSVPLTGGLPNAEWADAHIPAPVFGVDYTLTLNGCP